MGNIREFLERIFHELAHQKDGEIVGGHMVQDHGHMIVSIPPKYADSEVIGYMKGKSAIAIAWHFSGRKKNVGKVFGLEVTVFL